MSWGCGRKRERERDLSLTNAMRSLNWSQRLQMNSAKETFGISTSGTVLRRSAGEATGPELRHLANNFSEKSLEQPWLCCDDGWHDLLIGAVLSGLRGEVSNLHSCRMPHVFRLVRACIIMAVRNTARETQSGIQYYGIQYCISILKDTGIRLVTVLIPLNYINDTGNLYSTYPVAQCMNKHNTHNAYQDGRCYQQLTHNVDINKGSSITM